MLSRAASKDGTEFSSSHASSAKSTASLSKQPHDAVDSKIVTLVGVALFCDYLLLSLCIPILPELLSEKYSPFMIGLVFASKPFFQFFANPVMGVMVDKVGPTTPLFIGTLVLSMSTLFFAYGVSLRDSLVVAYSIVTLARSIQGVASACLMSAGMTLIAQNHSTSNRGAAMGLAMTGVALGTLLGPPVGGVLGFYVNLWMPFVLVAGVLLGVCIFQILGNSTASSENNLLTKKLLFDSQNIDRSDSTGAIRSDNSSQHNSKAPEEEPESVMSLLRDPHICFIGAVAVVGNAAIGMIEPLVPQWLDEEFGMNILWQGLTFGCASLAYLLLTPVAGFTSDSYPKWMCLGVGLVVMGTGLVLFVLADLVAMACVCLFLVGAGMAFVDTPILPLLADVVEVKMHGESALGLVYALNDMFLCIGFALGPVLGSAIQGALGNGTHGFKVTTAIIGSICFSLVPLTYVILKSIHTQKKQQEKEAALGGYVHPSFDHQ